MRTTNSLLPVCAATLMAAAGCAHRTVRPSIPRGVLKTDNSYMDLKPGWKLRIVVPLLKSGGYLLRDMAPQAQNGTIYLSAKDLIGYTVFHYVVLGRRNGLVRLKFLSAVTRRDWNAVTRNWNVVEEPRSPTLPFALPTGTKHIRLIYLLRVSEADHKYGNCSVEECWRLKCVYAAV